MTGHEKLEQAIHDAEKYEHDMEERIEELKHQDEVMHAPEAISRTIKASGAVGEQLRAPHLAD
jgi:hypothetical protein